MSLPFCECCGRPKQEILEEFSKIPFNPATRKRQVGVHFQYDNAYSKNFFYDDNKLRNCGSCGSILDFDDIKTEQDFVGMYGSDRAYQTLVLGYVCHSCFHKEEF